MLSLSAVGSYAAAVASDNASDTVYTSNGWQTGDNGGTGFGQWSLTASGGGGSYIGTTGLGTNSFGLFAGGSGNSDLSSADRPFTGALTAGQTFSIDLGHSNNIASGGGAVGLNLLSGSTVVFTLKFEGGDNFWELNNGGSDFNTSIGYAPNTPMTFTFTYDGGSQYDVTLTQGSNTYTGTDHTASNNISNITGVRLFSNKQGSNENAGFNNLQVVPEPSTVSLLIGSGVLGGVYLVRRRRA